MRILPIKILFLLLMFVPSQAWATWTCNEGTTGCTSSTRRSCTMSGVSSCAITITSTGAGSVEVVCGAATATTITFTFSGDGTWVTPSGQLATDTAAGSVECGYNLNATGGATSITCTASGTATARCVYANFSGSAGGITYDTASPNAVDDSSTCTSCSGVSITLGTAQNYLLLQSINTSSGTVSAISAPYSQQFNSRISLGWALNRTSDGAPTWTVNSGTAAVGGFGIYENSGATRCNSCDLSGALVPLLRTISRTSAIEWLRPFSPFR